MKFWTNWKVFPGQKNKILQYTSKLKELKKKYSEAYISIWNQQQVWHLSHCKLATCMSIPLWITDDDDEEEEEEEEEEDDDDDDNNNNNNNFLN